MHMDHLGKQNMFFLGLGATLFTAVLNRELTTIIRSKTVTSITLCIKCVYFSKRINIVPATQYANWNDFIDVHFY